MRKMTVQRNITLNFGDQYQEREKNRATPAFWENQAILIVIRERM
jgi:hypothetical protein